MRATHEHQEIIPTIIMKLEIAHSVHVFTVSALIVQSALIAVITMMVDSVQKVLV